MIIDTHCHVIDLEYDNIDEIINRFKDNIMIISGYDPISNRNVIDIVKKYKNVYGTLGFHPSEVDKFNEEEFNYIKNNINNSKIVGIGEIGLDYHYGSNDKEKQIKMFKSLLDLAQSENISVVIHTRDAAQDTMNILNNYKLKVDIHCFGYSLEIAKECIKRGYRLGIGGVLTFKNSKKMVDIVSNIPIENILLETDSPYLTPEPFRGKKNEPFYLSYVIDKISEIKKISINEVKKITTKNAKEQFDLNI